MKYQLKNKSTDEVVSVVEHSEFGVEEARNYFLRIKQLDEKEFDNLFSVNKEVVNKPKNPYKWWHEEAKTLDDF
tara:strand:+ start:193 stop:414 length:222 start_codon:yes stop_codon:yes gene_type:complete